MGYAQAYIEYLVHFHATRDYFECHEILEADWKSRPKNDPLSDTWVGLIQTAVAQYHHRRGNLSGAGKMFIQAADMLTAARLEAIGLDGAALSDVIIAKRDSLHPQHPAYPPAFADFDFPFRDRRLLAECRMKSAALGVDWGQRSRMADEDLIHRHTRRDRSSVASARAASLEAKKRKPH